MPLDGLMSREDISVTFNRLIHEQTSLPAAAVLSYVAGYMTLKTHVST
jgi:hypothetical protein